MPNLFLAAVLAWAACLSGAGEESTVFQRHSDEPFIPAREGTWREVSTANAAFLRTGRDVRLFIRGTKRGQDGQEHDQIGLFIHDGSAFTPDPAAWREHDGNPVVHAGPPHAPDLVAVLDTSVLVDAAGRLFLYYSARDTRNDYAIHGAWSEDGGVSFSPFPHNPLLRHVGMDDVVFHDGRVYLYYTSAQWNPEARRNEDRLRIYVAVSDDPRHFDFESARIALSPGDNAWDMFSIGGGRIFRLGGFWWMIYQGSDTHWDFPHRFHAAYSKDLIHWNKVQSKRPLFTRGEPGAWDQGAIWHGEPVVEGSKLYLLYEGWGSEGITHLRNRPYYPGGRSRIGLAVCDAAEFLAWAGVGAAAEATKPKPPR